MSEHIMYCPKCGNVYIDYFESQEDSVFGKCCINCSGRFKKVEVIDTKKTYAYFNDKAKPINEFVSDWKEEVRKEFIYDNPLYDKYADIQHREDIRKIEEKNYKATILRETGIETKNLPKCPTCGSSSIEKISGTNKVASAAMFGVFSLGHISKTFKCKNCGMKF